MTFIMKFPSSGAGLRPGIEPGLANRTLRRFAVRLYTIGANAAGETLPRRRPGIDLVLSRTASFP